MHLVILVARQHRVIEDDKSHVFMFRPGEKEGQPEAVKLRMAEDGDDIADFGHQVFRRSFTSHILGLSQLVIR